MKRNEFQEIVHEIAGKDYDYIEKGLNVKSIEKDRETLKIILLILKKNQNLKF